MSKVSECIVIGFIYVLWRLTFTVSRQSLLYAQSALDFLFIVVIFPVMLWLSIEIDEVVMA